MLQCGNLYKYTNLYTNLGLSGVNKMPESSQEPQVSRNVLGRIRSLLTSKGGNRVMVHCGLAVIAGVAVLNLLAWGYSLWRTMGMFFGFFTVLKFAELFYRAVKLVFFMA